MRTDWHCISFMHTVGWRLRDRDDDELGSFAGFVAWCVRRGLLEQLEGEELEAEAVRRPEDAEQALRGAHALRTLLYRIFTRIALGEGPDEARIEELNVHLRRLMPERRLSVAGDSIRWAWRPDPYRLDHPLGPLAWSAGELLTSPEVDRLKVCDADDCGWLFIDGSRNHSRRWCHMADCGNRHKVRRFRERKRKA